MKQSNKSGKIELSAPFERIFTQALMQGVLSPAQFVALLVKLNPTALLVNRAPSFSLNFSGLEIQFRLKEMKTDILSMSADKLAKTIAPSSLWLTIKDASSPHFDRRQDFNDLVAVGRRARRSGVSFTEGQALLDRLLAHCFSSSPDAPQHSMVKAHAIFTELYGKQEGDTIFFQQIKDFESRQERQFQTGDTILSLRKPAECAIAANHRNRLIARRNMGEVSVVEAAHQLSEDEKTSKIWVVGNDRDIVSTEQYLTLNPEKNDAKKRSGKTQDPVMLGKRLETPGVRLRPPIAQQHSRLVGEQPESKDGDARTYNVPTKDWLEYMGRINGVTPQIEGEGFTHKYAKSSAPFRTRFVE